MHSTKQNFNYEQKRWGVNPISSFYTDFHGLELFYFLKDVLPLVQKKKAIFLDSGCGAGNVADFIKRQFPDWFVQGIDISNDAINIAKKKFPRIKFKIAAAEKIPFLDKSIDVVTALDSLEHYEKIDQALTEIYRILRDDGLLYISIPLEKQNPSLYGLFYKLGWRGKMHFAGHVNFFTDKELVRLLKKHNFKLIKKRFSYHLFFSIADIGYFMLQSLLGNQNFSFETSVFQEKDGPKKIILTSLKKIISLISYLESRILFWFPGGKGHYVFVKERHMDFFSKNPPVTVLESAQRNFGMKKFIRPKDLHIFSHLNRLNFNKAAVILDYGCANGVWLERLLVGSKAKGIGIDIAQKLIDYANNIPDKKGEYYNPSDKWPLKNKTIDFCVSFDVFEHIPEIKEEILKIYKSLKPGGAFLFYTLNPNNTFTFDWLFEKLGSDALYKRADHKKEMFVSPLKMKRVLRDAGFKEISYCLYDGPFNLFYDVFCYGYLAILQKLLTLFGLTKLITPILYVNDQFIRILTPINDQLDKIFLKKGFSNGYFIWGKK